MRLPYTLTTAASSLMSRSYSDAIQALNSLQSNASVLANSRNNYVARAPSIIRESVEFLNRAGYSQEDLNALNVLHIAGTKGKGSTSAFCSSLLTTLAADARIGLYTSPHLVAVRERIRINGVPITEEMFAKYFWQVWDSYSDNPLRQNESTPLRPAYFRYLTIMAYHVFLSEKVDATVLEVGIGGLLDVTNIVPKPLATGITSLGLDHVAILGSTLAEIASAKAGIFKTDCPALSVGQVEEASKVVAKTAKDVQTSSFNVVEELPALKHVRLGLAGKHQRVNASLALALVRDFLQAKHLSPTFDAARALLPEISEAVSSNSSNLPERVRSGLEQASWPGRCQVIIDPLRPALTWYLDGAHTVESLTCCADWFGKEMQMKSAVSYQQRVLIFYCSSDRVGATLLEALTSTLKSLLTPTKATLFDHVIFCPNVTYANGSSKADLTAMVAPSSNDLTVQEGLREIWKRQMTHHSEQAEVHVLGSIEAAISFVNDLTAAKTKKEQISVLACGSLHLVGGVMEVAQIA